MTLTNEGPATARNIEFSISTLLDDGPQHFRAGPWTVDRLPRGGGDERQVYGIYASVVLVSVTWTDDDGPQDLSWSIDFPDRPLVQGPPRRSSR